MVLKTLYAFGSVPAGAGMWAPACAYTGVRDSVHKRQDVDRREPSACAIVFAGGQKTSTTRGGCSEPRRTRRVGATRAGLRAMGRFEIVRPVRVRRATTASGQSSVPVSEATSEFTPGPSEVGLRARPGKGAMRQARRLRHGRPLSFGHAPKEQACVEGAVRRDGVAEGVP